MVKPTFNQLRGEKGKFADNRREYGSRDDRKGERKVGSTCKGRACFSRTGLRARKTRGAECLSREGGLTVTGKEKKKIKKNQCWPGCRVVGVGGGDSKIRPRSGRKKRKRGGEGSRHISPPDKKRRSRKPFFFAEEKARPSLTPVRICERDRGRKNLCDSMGAICFA